MRQHNFSAGPAVLPLPVIEELRVQLLEFGVTGVGLMEISHRAAPYVAMFEQARAGVKRVLGLPDSHTVLLLQGGASTQFLMVAANLLQGGTADYLDTGTWARKALVEARRYGQVATAFESRRSCTQPWTPTKDAVYTHYTSNNTVYGTQFHHRPEGSGMLVCDMSSDIASRRIDGGAYDVIYAGAQKNLGPSGVTVVALSERAMARARVADVPTMLSYAVHADKDSMFNTPNTLGVYVLDRVLAWIEDQGMDAVAARNARKAAALYDLFDSSDFWQPMADPDSRSLMNVTWRLRDPALEAKLVADATAAGFIGIKGHRSVGGLRASIYNACPEESVQALVAFLRDFEVSHG